MSEQAEDASLRGIVDGFKSAYEAKTMLGEKLEVLGASLVRFGKTLPAPNLDWRAFSVDEAAGVTVRNPNLVTVVPPIAHVEPGQFDWKDLCETLRGYIKASEDRERTAAALKELGLPVR